MNLDRKKSLPFHPKSYTSPKSKDGYSGNSIDSSDSIDTTTKNPSTENPNSKNSSSKNSSSKETPFSLRKIQYLYAFLGILSIAIFSSILVGGLWEESEQVSSGDRIPLDDEEHSSNHMGIKGEQSQDGSVNHGAVNALALTGANPHSSYRPQSMTGVSSGDRIPLGDEEHSSNHMGIKGEQSQGESVNHGAANALAPTGGNPHSSYRPQSMTGVSSGDRIVRSVMRSIPLTTWGIKGEQSQGESVNHGAANALAPTGANPHPSYRPQSMTGVSSGDPSSFALSEPLTWLRSAYGFAKKWVENLTSGIGTGDNDKKVFERGKKIMPASG